MVTKIVNQLNSINKYSKQIIIVASITSLALCISGIAIITYNNLRTLNSIFLQNVGSSMICSSITLFTIFTIGSLVIDLFNAFVNNHDE